MGSVIDIMINFGLPLALLIVAYFVGSALERRHFNSIVEREAAARDFPVLTVKSLPPDQEPTDVMLLVGSVVVSLDYFKRVIAGFRGLIGGRIKTYEPLLDRARREALLRLIERARQDHYDALINVRLETSRLASGRGGDGTAGVEMLAFGTAVRLRTPSVDAA